MNYLSGINLNLLLVLDMLLKEQNVSRAAEKLNLTQPTVSNSLKQLRIIFDDELLFRGPANRMKLTGKAKKIKPEVAEAVSRLEYIFKSEEEFNPDKETYHFKLGMSDYSSVIYLPVLMKEIAKYSDNISIEVKHMNNIWTYDDYCSANVDLAIGNYSVDNDIINKEILFTSNIVCAASADHPAFQKKQLTLDDFFEYQYLSVFYKKEFWEEVDKIILEKTGRKRRIALQVPYMLVGLKLISETNYIALLSNKVAEKYAGLYNLKVRETPIKFPTTVYKLYWSKSEASNPANKWLREIISRIKV